MSLVSEYEIFKKNGGAFEVPKRIIRVSGPDAGDFLHRLTTQDVKNLRPGFGFPAAVLQPDAKIVSFFDLYHCGNFFLIVVDEDLFKSTLDYFEKFHFAEDLKIQDDTSAFGFLSVQGPQSETILVNSMGRVPQDLSEVIGTEDCFITRRDEIIGKGYNLLVKASQISDLKRRLKSAGLAVLSLELWTLLRSESGHFKFGVDISDKNLILESALSGYVSRNKGCYPGQEVVERVFTYGNVAKKLVGLEWVSGNLPEGLSAPFKLFADGQEVGKVTSMTTFPWSEKKFGFALVRKPFYEEGKTLTCFEANSPQNVKVVSLPNTFEIKREVSALEK